MVNFVFCKFHLNKKNGIIFLEDKFIDFPRKRTFIKSLLYLVVIVWHLFPGYSFYWATINLDFTYYGKLNVTLKDYVQFYLHE